jgi:2-desacetyl-2-hydroxyethyl bacteriochlorophyllide A dehydrogenase
MQQGKRAVMPEPYKVTCETFPVPSPGLDQVVVETEASAISAGTELAVYTGVHQWLNDPARTWPRFPFVPGYSAVGRIAAAGKRVQGWTVGERVIWPGRHESHAVIDVGRDSARLWRIAGHVPAPVAACALLTRFPLTAVVRSGEVLGQSVAVLGLGLIGQLTLRLFGATGAYPLIGIDPVARRRALAEDSYGAAVLDPSTDDLPAALRAVNHGALPDIVVDATGFPDTVNTAMTIVTDGGRVVMVGSPRGIARQVDFYWDLHGRSISLIGAHGSAIGDAAREKFPFTQERALRLIAHLIESGKLRVDDLITHHVDGSALPSMYEGLLHERNTFIGVTAHWSSLTTGA